MYIYLLVLFVLFAHSFSFNVGPRTILSVNLWKLQNNWIFCRRCVLLTHFTVDKFISFMYICVKVEKICCWWPLISHQMARFLLRKYIPFHSIFEWWIKFYTVACIWTDFHSEKNFPFICTTRYIIIYCRLLNCLQHHRHHHCRGLLSKINV